MGTWNVLCFAFAGERRAFHSLEPTWRARLQKLLCVAAFLGGSLAAAAQTTLPGAVIENTAHISYVDVTGTPVSIETNTVSVTAVAPPSMSSISLLRASNAGEIVGSVGLTQCLSADGPVALAAPTLVNGTKLDPTGVIALSSAVSLHGGEPLFIRLQDADQNKDASSIDTVELRLTAPSGDSERLRLAETGVDSGVFVGYIQTSMRSFTAGNCTLEVERNSEVSSIYADPSDDSDMSRASALIDPYGVIFDSRTGEPIDGARVRLLDASSGMPAVVFGDDGVSRYPAEMVTGEAITDAGGTLYTLPAGVYRFPLIPPGNYRIEVDPPAGHAFPSALTMSELAQTPGAPYRLQTGSLGEVFTAADSPIIALDVPVDPAATQLFVQKTAMTNVAAIGDFVQYSLAIENAATNAAVPSVRTVDTLPLGVRYRAGSTRVGGEKMSDPAISSDGRELTFVTGALAPRQRIEIRYVVEITAGARGKQLVNAARAIGPDGVTSNSAQATIQLREELFRERAIVMGRVVEGDCSTPSQELSGVAGVRVYLEDGRYAVTDEEGKYHFEDIAPGSHVVQVDTITVPESHLMQDCRQGVRHAGRSYSQFIDVRGGALWRADFRLQRKVAPRADRPYAVPTPRRADAAPKAIDIETLQPGIKWLTPGADDIAAIPALKIEIQHSPSERIELLANGAAVSPLNFDGVTSNRAKTVSVSLWRGVALRDGDNEIVAIVRDGGGKEVRRLVRSIRYGGGAVRAQIDRAASTLLADGRTHPVIALRMIDASGHPARPGTTGQYSIEAPYRSWWEVQSLDDNKLVSAGSRQPIFTVDPDGLARLVLEPTTQAGTAVVRIGFSERQEQVIRVWLEPAARDWILVGIAEGTAAHKYISDNMQSARNAGLEDGYSEEGRVAFFAKGTIKGEYLLTAAYDSAREHELEKEHLLGAVEPDRFYTLYGDATEQRFEAATARKLFLKLERRQFAALFGDFETGMTVTELSRYSRTFTGFKSDYAGERFGFTAFAAESEQGYVKDELQGDGTSGLYRLSRRPLIINTDKVRIEVRDRIRTEVIVETRELTRHIDYSIDYLNGALFFKQPVPSRDGSFNPVFIIAEYEVLSGGEVEMTAGGRASVKFANDRIEVGGSFLREGATTGDSQIAGTDLRWQIGAATELRAEVARTDTDDPTRSSGASAYVTELEHIGENLDARVYVREQESGFGLGQQLALDTGTRKAGVDGRYRLAEEIAIEAETFRQEVLDTGAVRELVSGEVRYESDDYTAGVGARHVADVGPQTGETKSQQAFVNGSVDLFNDLITLRASQDLALGGKNGSVDFPNRSVIGVDYHWRPETSFFAEYEHADGERFDADMTRVGVRSAPWQRAQFQSSLNQQATEYGPRAFANVGLTQGWQLNDRWGFDVGIDQSKTVSGTGIAPFDTDVPLSSGTLNGDFLATFIGALYRSELWAFTTRFEHRDSDAEDRWIASGGFYREPVAGHAFSLATQWFDSAFSNGTDATAADVQLAWAYRPASSAWIVLNRLDLKHEARTDLSGAFESARIINNLNSSVQLDTHTQLGVQFGARYVRSTFDGERYSGMSTLYGIDMRRDLTHRFDVGIHGTMLSSLQSNVSDRAIGLDLGVSLGTNMWVSIGYNFNGFEDEDFEASRYTAQGPFIKFRMKADQETFRDLVGIGRRAR